MSIKQIRKFRYSIKIDEDILCFKHYSGRKEILWGEELEVAYMDYFRVFLLHRGWTT